MCAKPNGAGGTQAVFMNTTEKDNSEKNSQDAVTDPDGASRPRRRGYLLKMGVFALVILAGAAGALAWLQRSIQANLVAQANVKEAPRIVIPSGKGGPESSGGDNNTITNTGSSTSSQSTPTGHPIDSALARAQEGLEHSQKTIVDYTAQVTKIERAKNGTPGKPQTMFLKVRNRKVDEEGNLVTPFGVYMKFLKPSSVAGREVIWVENANDGKLIAHEAGLLNLIRAHLPPDGKLAMMGQRYPIWEIGMENLIQQLLKRGEKERQHEQCDVEFIRDAMIGDHKGTMIRVMHPEKKPEYEFHKVEIFIDDARNIPLHYAAYMWPETEGGEPIVDESYTYQDVKLNVGLTDEDFNPDNSEYNYP